jgi:hypothetical protein
VHGVEDLRWLYQWVELGTGRSGPDVSQQVIYERELTFGLLSCIPIELVKQVSQLSGEGVRDALRCLLRRQASKGPTSWGGKVRKRTGQRIGDKLIVEAVW